MSGSRRRVHGARRDLETVAAFALRAVARLIRCLEEARRARAQIRAARDPNACRDPPATLSTRELKTPDSREDRGCDFRRLGDAAASHENGELVAAETRGRVALAHDLA